MKAFGLLFLISVVPACVLAATRDELMQRAVNMGEACRNKEGASEQDLQEFLMHQVPTTEVGKCFRACIMETLNVLIDNKPNLENALKVASEGTNGNQQAIQLARELHEECVPDAIGPNRCETAYNIIKCISESLNRRGIDPAQKEMKNPEAHMRREGSSY